MSAKPASTTMSQDEIQSHVDKALSKLEESWKIAARTSQLSRMMYNTTLVKGSDDDSDENEQYRLDLIRQSFYNETNKRITDRIKYTTDGAFPRTDIAGTSRSPLHVDVSSVFAQGQENPQEWLDDFAASVLQEGLENMVINAAMGMMDPSIASHVVNVSAVEDLYAEIIEQGVKDAMDGYEESCKDMSVEQLEDKLKDMSGLFHGQPLSLWQSLARWSTKSVGHISGQTKGSYAVEESPFNLKSLDDTNESLRKKLTKREAEFKSQFGSAPPENLDPENLPESARADAERLPPFERQRFSKFQPSDTIRNNLFKIYESNNGTQPPEEQDILYALSIPTPQVQNARPGSYKLLDSRISFFRGVDRFASAVSNDPSCKPFKRAGMVPDDTFIDWNRVDFSLVEEDNIDAPTNIQELWPKRIEDVTSAGHLAGQEKSEKGESEKGEWSLTEEDFSYLTR
ncbi:hypothetical protein L198_06636 [Cryptococcus wingfieldii CBS 7118]|uniref:Uncharacterized protein n=1 Tax=Cryptococcus wingfieldii CBS 7118 TaxID=1295528 RepID=A0A1E3IJP7_9TREE|nr:hypothetical protein L198_06636 [Cryptococcus wingfieldii CBS 7118]ODN88834.1 hypothetical protein L198_06636 [Cryptococcus wingfieldii CBS 7118]